ASEIVERAHHEAESVLKQAELDARQIAVERQAEFDAELREHRVERQRIDDRLHAREQNLLERQSHLDRREHDLETRLSRFEAKLEAHQEMEKDFAVERATYFERLAEIGKLSVEAARRQLMAQIAVEARHDAAQLARKYENEMRETVKQRARMTLATAIERLSGEFSADNAVVVVNLPNDEMKGRIIGKEGRNIRAFELHAGVDLIVDETPEAILLSSYDPMRRDIAKRALERLIEDGRIHPARIEEMVADAREEVESGATDDAREVAESLGIVDLPEEILEMMGRLRYRTSYGQNVLHHSKDVAMIAATLAAEMGENTVHAKRAGLLHDLGKAAEHFVEGNHVDVATHFLRQHGESPEVLHAIESHHEGVEAKSALAVILIVADRISAARPGARRDSLEQYAQRLGRLEEIADGFKGVERAFAIQAGRELRVIVQADKVDDDAAFLMAKEIARKVGAETQFPGPVQVTVIRETRATAFANSSETPRPPA
ncbi:MAG: ribonuclease Y, partial [Candidatus Poribacteria bacterium]|nr:ribonuclease Y [Candidatus Poribacteria bacterium]